MRRAWETTVAIVAGALALAACGDDDGRERGGSSEVHDQIEASTDCAFLQEQFDTASANFDAEPDAGSAAAEAALGFMEAAEARMDEVGC